MGKKLLTDPASHFNTTVSSHTELISKESLSDVARPSPPMRNMFICISSSGADFITYTAQIISDTPA